jgi:hypothetical protein
VVRIRCDLAFTMFGVDTHEAMSSLSQALRADASPYVEFELVGGRLQAVKVHHILTNEVGRDTDGSTVYCDPLDAQVDGFVRNYGANGWRQLARLPYSYRMQNDAVTTMFAGEQTPRTGRWYTFQRGVVIVDLFNARYVASVLGKNGACNGGAIDEYAMLAPIRTRRVKPGIAVSW